MRFRDFLLTVLISVLATVLTVQLLITLEYIPTQGPSQTQIRQNITGEFTTPAIGYPPPTRKVHQILNATKNAALRILHIYIEFNVISNPNQVKIEFYLWLVDDSLNRKKVAEVKDSDITFGVLSLDINVNTNHAYSVWIWAASDRVSNGTYQGRIVQDLSF